MKQAELIHTGWTIHDREGLLLQQVAEFDNRDSILLGEEIKEFEYTHQSYGRGPNFSAIRTKRIDSQNMLH